MASLVVTYRHLTDDMPIAYQKLIDGPAKLVDIAVDGRFLIVFYMRFSPLPRSNEIYQYNVDVRLKASFEAVHSIQFKSYRYCFFDVFDGVIVTALKGNKLR